MASVVFFAPSAYLLSGLATWLDYLIPGLARAGWDARLALVSGPHHHLPDRYLEAHPSPAVSIVHCQSSTSEGRAIAVGKSLAEVQPDVAVSVNIPDLFVGINRRRRSHAPSPHAVMSVHGIEAYLYADTLRFQALLDGVVCTNRLSCALTESLGKTEPAKIFYAGYGVELAGSGRSGAVAPASNTKVQEALRIVYSGRLESGQKRARDLAVIAQCLWQRGVPFRLDIVGDGPDRDWLHDHLGEHVSAGRVCFHGYMAIDELKENIYARADALLITSLWETGPLVAWEAMSQGVPVVSTRYIGSGLEGALVDGETALLFDVGDTAAAAAAFELLWKDVALRRKISDSGRALVAARYSIEASVRDWSGSLSAVLRRPQAGAMSLPISAGAGRLDRWLGPAVGEHVRSALPRGAMRNFDAGGEWPNSHAGAPSDALFWSLAQKVDCRTGAHPPASVETYVA